MYAQIMYAQILLSKGIMGFAKLTAQEGIGELPPPKNNAQREHLQLDQSLELKRAFVIFANKGDPSAKMAASTMLRPKQIAAGARHTCFASIGKKTRKTTLRHSCVKHGAKMCEDDTHNKGKSIRKSNCVACSPNLICPHGLRTCSQCKPGLTNHYNLITRHTKERETFYGNTAAEYLALTEEKQSELSLDFKDLRDNAIIESGSEEKRRVIRRVKQHQVEQLCCKLPFAFSQINAFLKQYKAQIFLKDDLLLLQ